jgi:hypothetical protein
MSHRNSFMTLDAVACRALRLVLAMALLVEEQHPVVAPIVLVLEIGIAWRRQSWIAGRFDLSGRDLAGEPSLLSIPQDPKEGRQSWS